MTLAIRHGTPATADTDALASEGIHRDTSLEDPVAGTTFSQRVVRAASSLLARGQSRRSFLTKTAVVGSALAIGPVDFILRPGTAYAYVCGTCGDGWTAFCCTINGGRNSCPSGSFIAGWWKADNAAYCCGAARYIIDCNASCPTSCRCRCTGASCDGRRTCCNQFRYGQCHQEISCYGPVVCRVATCTPPWQYSSACSSASATDNATVNHGAPCLSTDCGKPPPASAIAKKYAALGGSAGILGPVVQREQAVSDGRGRYAVYRNGRIYWTARTGAHEVHGSILTQFGHVGGIHGQLGYPTADTQTSSDKRSRYSNFEGGRIYYWAAGTFEIHGSIFYRHEGMRGVHGVLGYPKSNVLTSSDKRSRYTTFEHGRIYVRGSLVTEIHGAVFTHHEALGGVHGVLGYPESDVVDVGDGRGKTTRFEDGSIYYTPGLGAHEVHGAIARRYRTNGGPKGYLRYPKADTRSISDHRGRFSEFERGRIYWTPQTGAFEVHGAVLEKLFSEGDVTGHLGYPTSELVPVGTLRRQTFEHGSLTYHPATGTVTVG